MMKTIGYVTMTTILIVYANLLNWWALCLMWGWFVVPTFGASLLSIPQAIGLSCIATYLTHQISTKKDDRKYGEILFIGFFIATLKPIAAVLFASVVSYFI